MSDERAKQIAIDACSELQDAGFPACVLYFGHDDLWHMARLALPPKMIAKGLRALAEALDELPDGTLN